MHQSAIISAVNLLSISATAFAGAERGKVEVVDRRHALGTDGNRPNH